MVLSRCMRFNRAKVGLSSYALSRAFRGAFRVMSALFRWGLVVFPRKRMRFNSAFMLLSWCFRGGVYASIWHSSCVHETSVMLSWGSYYGSFMDFPGAFMVLSIVGLNGAFMVLSWRCMRIHGAFTLLSRCLHRSACEFIGVPSWGLEFVEV